MDDEIGKCATKTEKVNTRALYLLQRWLLVSHMLFHFDLALEKFFLYCNLM
jgi:hypothetical protein